MIIKNIDNNISNIYCSIKVYDLLKSKGFILQSLYDDKLPTISIALEWLRINFNIWIEVEQHYTTKIVYEYHIKENGSLQESLFDIDNPKEAYEKAFLCCLTKIIK